MSVRTIAAATTTAVALVAAPALTAQATTHPATATARAAHVRTITYAGAGARIHDARDVRKLRATSARFQDFTVREVRRQRTEVQKGCDVNLYVKSYRTDGFATGSLWAKGCGGATAVWATKQGVWGQIWQGQYQPTCKQLSARAGRAVPKGLAGCR